MSDELAYILITPYSLLKSRTGGIIGRLLSLTTLDLVGARLYAPGDAFVDQYCESLQDHEMNPSLKEGLLNYVREYFRAQNPLGITNRTLGLFFRGERAVERIGEAVGSLSANPQGDTVRGTYGDFIGYATGELKYFEPAVLTATTPEMNRRQLKLLADHAVSDGGLLEDIVSFPQGVAAETTLVILKPDNFRLGSSRPGNIIDMFSKTGLFIVGAKMIHLSVAQAEEFYAPLLALFVERLKSGVVEKVKAALGTELEFEIPSGDLDRIGDILKAHNAQHEFYRIIEYMTGWNPRQAEAEGATHAPGKVKCLALLYRGVQAVDKVRERLGATNPVAAAPGTVRSVYGEDLMKNGAHASDSPESAERERRVIGMWEQDDAADLCQLIETYLAS